MRVRDTADPGWNSDGRSKGPRLPRLAFVCRLFDDDDKVTAEAHLSGRYQVQLENDMVGAAMCARVSRDLDHSHLHFDRLLGTRVEGEWIASKLNVQPWLADQALEAHLKACRSPRIVHLATHGFFLQDQPRDPNKERRDLGALAWQAEGGWGRRGWRIPCCVRGWRWLGQHLP